MSKRFWVVSAAMVALAAPGAALAASPQHHAPPPALPDFPPDAEPGACYARTRGEGPSAPDGPGVWTLKRGHGPEAVWSYSEPAAGPHASASGYRWVRVLCKDGMTPYGGPGHAHAGPATGTTGAGLAPPPPMAAPPPPPPHVVEVRPHGSDRMIEVRPHRTPHAGQHAAPHGGRHAQPRVVERPPHAPPHHGAHAAPHHAIPFAHAPMEGPPPAVHFFTPAHPPMHPPMHGPMGPHYGGPPTPPPPMVSPPRWFGDRYLHWAGKRPAW